MTQRCARFFSGSSQATGTTFFELPIIVISGAVDLSAPPFARLAECFDVREAIPKPFDPALILSKVRAAIGHPTGLEL